MGTFDNRPSITVDKDESLDGAYRRAVDAFTAAGLKCNESLNAEAPFGEFARTFFIADESEWHLFYICPFVWNEEREDDITPNFAALMEEEYRDVYCHIIAAYEVPSQVRYFFSNPRRAGFIMAMNSYFSRIGAVTPQNIAEYAMATTKVLKAYYAGRLKKSESRLETIDYLVLDHLRSVRDPEAKDDGPLASGVVSGLGALAGELIRESTDKQFGTESVWIADGNELLLDIGFVEKKGFFSRAQRRSILQANPIGKVDKLFRSGASESIESFFRATTALVKENLSH